MIIFLKQILNKIRNIRQTSPIEKLIEQGLLKRGQDCKLDGLTIIVVDKTSDITNLEIGNDCCIQGTIIIYRANAKVRIGNNVYIGPGTLIECVEEIEIGNDILISGNCNLVDTNSHSLHSSERVHDTVDWQKGLLHKNWEVVDSNKIIIESKCWIGLRSIILKGVKLAEGTIVGAGSVVTKDSEQFSIIAGNPAKFIKYVD
jgi:acetyltransferase-like isoleucine patch superfamily enzyme